MKKIVSVAPCNSLKVSTGEISRLAAYRVVEIERPQSTFLLGLPGLDAKKDKNVYAVHHFPQVAIEGCEKQCATRILKSWKVTHLKSLTVPELLNTYQFNAEEISVWPPNQMCLQAVTLVACSAAAAVDAYLEDYPSLETDDSIAHAYICSACGWVYNPRQGDPDYGVAPGTAFDDLPENWCCSVCAVPADNFEPVGHRQ